MFIRDERNLKLQAADGGARRIFQSQMPFKPVDGH
jgi:hypothetical protein